MVLLITYRDGSKRKMNLGDTFLESCSLIDMNTGRTVYGKGGKPITIGYHEKTMDIAHSTGLPHTITLSREEGAVLVMETIHANAPAIPNANWRISQSVFSEKKRLRKLFKNKSFGYQSEPA